MKRSPSLNRLVLVLCVVVFAIAALAAQIAVLTELPSVAASLQGGVDPFDRLRTLRIWERAHEAVTQLTSPVQSAGMDALQEQVQAQSPSVPVASSPEREVQAAWQRAQQAGAYRFATRLVQTTYPAPALVNVGRSSRQETVYLEGDVDLPERTMLMSLWQGDSSVLDPRGAVQVRIQGDQAYGRSTDGEWQEMDNFAGSFAPGNDALAYLAGAKNVKREDTDSRFTFHVSRLTFDLDGPAFADYIRHQLEQHLRETGELPPGVYLDAPNQFRDAIGDGEVWIDGDGLPLRLTMHLEYPQERNGERIKVDIQTDFSNFDRETLAQAPGPFASPVARLNNAARRAQKHAGQVGLGIAFSSLVMLALAHSRSKRFYTALVIVVIVSMVFTPLLQSNRVYAFTQKQAARQAEYEREQEEQRAVREIQEELMSSQWDPHADPLSVIGQTSLARDQLLEFCDDLT